MSGCKLMDEIVGFEYEEGFEYKLRVESHPFENDPSDIIDLRFFQGMKLFPRIFRQVSS